MEQEKANIKISRDGISLESVTVNTFLTLIIAFGVAGIGSLMWMHQQETKEASTVFIGALKEQTVALREQTAAQKEQNCLLKFEQSERKENSDWCKQMAGVR